MTIKMKQLPESERPYEKLQLYGEKVLSNAELLAIIIKSGTREETSVQLAQKILKLNDTETDDLTFLQKLSIEELIQIKGIGRIKAIQIKAVCELSSRMSQPSNYQKVVIKTPEDLAKILMPKLRFQKQEIVQVIVLNSKNQILKIKDIAIGSSNSANLQIKDVLEEPIKINAPKIILAHNHPTGDSTPSKQDIEFTNKLYELSALLGIELLDHLVIGNMQYTSIFSQMISTN